MMSTQLPGPSSGPGTKHHSVVGHLDSRPAPHYKQLLRRAESKLLSCSFPMSRGLPAYTVPKEQSGGDGSVQRELCVFVPDACNTFPLPTAILPVRRWLKIRVVTARRLLLPPRSRAYRRVSSRWVLPTQVDSPVRRPGAPTP